MKYLYVHDESLQDKGKDNAHAVYGTSQWELLGYMWLVNKEDFSYSITFPFASQISNLKFFQVISNYCMKHTSGDERCLSLDKCKS